MQRMLLHSLLWICTLIPANSVRSDDWPQWRGPNRDGVWHETGTLEKFASKQLSPVWRAEIGSGYSGPTVADGYVYVTDRFVEPKQIERVLCFDAASGEPIWKYEYDCPYVSIGYPAGPRACVAIDEGKAYSLGSTGRLLCFDARTGDLLWSNDLEQLYSLSDPDDKRMPIWGIAAAPLIYGKLLIVPIGATKASIVAFDKASGEEVWKSLDDRGQYSAPILVHQGGQPVVVCWTGDSVAGLNPGTGEVYWRYAFKPVNMPIGVASPVVDRDRLFVTSFYDGSLMLRLAKDRPAVEPIWQRKGANEINTDALHSIINTPVIDGDYIYGVDSYGQLRCLDAKNGDRIWEDLTATPKDRWSTIHIVRQQDKYWMFNERGELIIARLSPQGFEEISRAQLIDPTEGQLGKRGGVCWSHPAFANRHVFARNDREILCVDLSREK